MSEQNNLELLIDAIEEKNVQAVKNSIPSIDTNALKKIVDCNNNTLAHYVFSSNNQEIITSFVNRLEELNLSRDVLKILFGTTNIGGFTPVDRILQKNAAPKIEAALKGIHNTKILEAFLSATNEYGKTIHEVAQEELPKNKIAEFEQKTHNGITYLHDNSEWLWSFVDKSRVYQKKQRLVKKYAQSEDTSSLEGMKGETTENQTSTPFPKSSESSDNFINSLFASSISQKLTTDINAVNLPELEQNVATAQAAFTTPLTLQQNQHIAHRVQNQLDQWAITKFQAHQQQHPGRPFSKRQSTKWKQTLKTSQDGRNEHQRLVQEEEHRIKQSQKQDLDAAQNRLKTAQERMEALKTKEKVLKWTSIAHDATRLADDIDHLVFGDSLKQAVGNDNAHYVSLVIKLTSDLVRSAYTKNPLLLANDVLQEIASYTAHNDNPYYLYDISSLLLLGTAVGTSFVLGSIPLGLFTLATQGTSTVLDLATSHGYISSTNPIVNYAAKPFLTAVNGITNMALNPFWWLKGFEGIHLIRESVGYWHQYQQSFEITDDQFPVLKKLGYSATEMYGGLEDLANDGAIRQSYNEKITNLWEKHYAPKAKEAHCAGKEISSDLAQEAVELRNEVKDLHHLVTSLLGRATIDVRQALKCHTLTPDYNHFHDKGKSDEDIFYAAFKTDGQNLGLQGNSMDEILKFTEEANIICSFKKDLFYPEAFTPEALTCIGNSTSEAICTKLHECNVIPVI